MNRRYGVRPTLFVIWEIVSSQGLPWANLMTILASQPGREGVFTKILPPLDNIPYLWPEHGL